MKTVCLNAAAIPDRAALHGSIARQLGFPDWYGGNLDALYDLLTERAEPPRFLIVDAPALRRRLGDYYDRLLAVLRDAGCAADALPYGSTEA